MRPENFLNDKESKLVNEYLSDKCAFTKDNPELSVKAVELYNKYLNLLTKYYIQTVKRYNFLESNIDFNITPFGMYSLL